MSRENMTIKSDFLAKEANIHHTILVDLMLESYFKAPGAKREIHYVGLNPHHFSCTYLGACYALAFAEKTEHTEQVLLRITRKMDDVDKHRFLDLCDWIDRYVGKAYEPSLRRAA